jgi:hypothetical protein
LFNIPNIFLDDQDSKTAPTFSNLEHEEINLKDSSGEKTGECNSAEDDENLDDYVEMKRVAWLHVTNHLYHGFLS